ncbi:MAG: hypothetical protein VKJ06_08120 [Vampirovibrionales bacterium]|nr:hypothetical protein [Vampirovibrionales bacterium]
MGAGALFSQRFGHSIQNTPISVREEAPEALRQKLLEILRNLNPRIVLRDKIVKNLFELLGEIPPDLRDCYDDDLISSLDHLLIDGLEKAEWFYVYDFVELTYEELQKDDEEYIVFNARSAILFRNALNKQFYRFGIGYELKDGKIEPRGDNPHLTEIANKAGEALDEAGFAGAKAHLKEAFQDLGRRPEADLKGCISHASSALEAVAKKLTNDPKATLGEIIKKGNLPLPKPLDAALAQIWGYASNDARHGSEDANPSFEEAELVFSLCATMTTYLLKKHEQTPPPTLEANS